MAGFSFSYSRWSLWRKCPQAFRYKTIDKLPDPAGTAMLRGREVHTAMEKYVTGEVDERPKEAGKFTAMVDAIRAWEPDLRLVEQQMGYDRHQRPAQWFGPNTYYRFVWDVGLLDAAMPTHVEIVDWKTGKPYGSYTDQMQLFSIPAFLKYPKAETVRTHLVFLDNEYTDSMTFTRDQFPTINDTWRANAAMMEADQSFPATPSRDACRFCNFSRHKGGPCQESAY